MVAPAEVEAGLPGDPQFRIVKFEKHVTRIPDWKDKDVSIGVKEAPTLNLLGSSDPVFLAELQWRLSTPIAALLLAFLAFPLSKTTPRQGRYGKLAIAIFVYLVYINLLLVAVNWISKGDLPPVVGVWWVHLSVLTLAIILYARDHRLGKLRLARRKKG